MSESHPAWPELPYTQWRDTCATLHLWTQIVGKIRLAQTPWINHDWQVPLYLSARGLTTTPIAYRGEHFEMEFDFIDHALNIEVSDDRRQQIALKPQSVAQFYDLTLGTLAEMNLPVSINEAPCEIAGAIAFSHDHTHASYDRESAHRFWRVLLQVDRVFKIFRSGFLGKASPVHFFWGSFDLAVTRFSGRAAPAYSGVVPGVSQAIMREAYSHEVSSAGFWPGSDALDYAAFYSYAYPEPPGFRQHSVRPDAAFMSETLGEFLLPYDAVRTASNPDATLLEFLHSSYEAAALNGHWDRSLECEIGRAGAVRAM